MVGSSESFFDFRLLLTIHHSPLAPCNSREIFPNIIFTQILFWWILDFGELITVTFTLFAVIDIIGSVPILISLKQKMGGIRELRATLIPAH